MMGLPRSEALELAAQSKQTFVPLLRVLKSRYIAMQGAARMVLQSGSHPATIKDNVTSKSKS